MVTTRPKVHIVATGGSISGIGPDRLDYLLYPELGQRLSIEDMLERIPEVETVAQVQGENLIRVGSPAIGPPEWLQLAKETEKRRCHENYPYRELYRRGRVAALDVR